MDNDIWIVSQGPLNFTFTQALLAYYEDIPNMVFSSWEEDTMQLANDLLLAFGIHNTITSREGLTIGRAHLNLQCKSVLNGIKYAKNHGAKYIFKTRSDLTIPNITQLAQQMKYDFVASKKLFGPMLWDSHHSQTGDLMSFGTVEESELYWNIDDHLTVDGFAEKILITEYLRKKGISDYQMNADDLSKYFYWCFGAVDKLNMTIKWEKYCSQRDNRSPLEWHLRRDKGYIY